MAEILEKIRSLTANIEEKKEEIKNTENSLEAQIEMKKKERENMEQDLKEAHWQEKLERADKELTPFCREERHKEDKINRIINKAFDNASKIVERINPMFKELEELRKKISDIENQLIQSSGNSDLQIRDAIEFKKAEIIREVEVTEQLKGASSLVRQVNAAMGLQDGSDEDLFGTGFNRLPIYAQNIYDEVKRAGGKPVRAKRDEFIRVARIPDPRIIKAREELNKNLEVLVEKDLITYEQEGETVILRENNIKE